MNEGTRQALNTLITGGLALAGSYLLGIAPAEQARMDAETSRAEVEAQKEATARQLDLAEASLHNAQVTTQTQANLFSKCMESLVASREMCQ